MPQLKPMPMGDSESVAGLDASVRSADIRAAVDAGEGVSQPPVEETPSASESLRWIPVEEPTPPPVGGGRLPNDPKSLIRRCIPEVADRFATLGHVLSARIGAETLHLADCGGVSPPQQSTVLSTATELLRHSQGGYRVDIRVDESVRIAYVLVPLTPRRDDEVVGSCVFVCRFSSDLESKLLATQLQAAMGVLHLDTTAALNSGGRSQQEGSDLQNEKRLTAIPRATKYANVTEFSFTLVNSIAQRFELEQTAIGMVEGQKVKVVAVSGQDTLKANSPGIVEIEQVMTETLDHGKTIQYNENGQASGQASLPIHRSWARSCSNAVASIPIYDGEQCVAVLCLRRHETAGIADEMLADLESNVTAFGPAIQILRRSQRTLLAHAKDSARSAAKTAANPKTVVGLVARVAVAAVLAFFFLGWMPYRPTTTCTIVPTGLNHSLAAFDMTLQSVHVRSGDVVKAGALMVEFDDRELQLQRNGILAERAQAEVEIRSSIAKGDAAAATLAKANTEVLNTRLNVIEKKIRQCKLRAPVDGMIVKADLRDRIGQIFPQGQQVLSFAPMDAWTLELQVPEHLAPHIEPGQEGSFASVSQPNVTLGYRIESIAGNTELVSGRNVFIATAEVEEVADWMRFGMEGVAATRTGWRPVIWIALHRVWEIGRLNFWI